VFVMVITDFGAPKVIGGQYNVLATDVYKQVIGQQNFEMGAVVGMILLIPAVLAFAIDRIVQRRQVALLSARAVPLEPKQNRVRDMALLGYCGVVVAILIGVLGTSVWASFITYWPYNLSLTLSNYDFSTFDQSGLSAYFVSVAMAALAAIIGTAIVFSGAYLVEKTKVMAGGRAVAHLLAMLPMAVPGLVLGLGYIFFFNAPGNPLHGLYHTMTLLVLCTIVHFYTTGHLTAVTALKALDAEFEAVSASLKVPFYRTFWRVTLPICTPALVDISRYFFINAMTTISAVVFLYSPDTKVASIAILNLDEAGEPGAAAAMAVLIAATSLAACILYLGLGWLVDRKTQKWRNLR